MRAASIIGCQSLALVLLSACATNHRAADATLARAGLLFWISHYLLDPRCPFSPSARHLLPAQTRFGPIAGIRDSK
jgi:hypothetical protein